MGKFKIAGPTFTKKRENNGNNWKESEWKCYFDKIAGYQLF